MEFVQNYFINRSILPVVMYSVIRYSNPRDKVDDKCLVDWFKEAKRCPTCRERVSEKPVVSYLVNLLPRDI